MRGEKFSENAPLQDRQGSPPHARGKANEKFCCTALTGITPACAGKSIKEKQNGIPLWDHPRMRGEKFRTFF